ncbi:Ig-like domain-containing protein [Escherichia coli]
MFPSLNEGETYTLTVQAKDEMNHGSLAAAN